MNTAEALALLVASFQIHAHVEDDAHAELERWLEAKAKDGTPRPVLLASKEGPTELKLIARRVRYSGALPEMIQERPQKTVDRFVVRAAVQILQSGTRWCDDDPPPDGAAG